MIICEHIKKAYKTQKVFTDFSYEFEDTGFYLFFGESGSGKTTLLNILAGYIQYDDGIVFFNGEKYNNRVNAEDIGSQIDYITQDTNFIDYLSVYDNLALCTTNDKLIDEYLNKFGIADKKDMLPSKLSGGERQRICLIRSLVQNKKIILLDEPTASLDNENKQLVFETLKDLKESVLIICSSHDEVAKEYADKFIDFNNIETYREGAGRPNGIENIEKVTDISKESGRKLGPYIKKWFKSSSKEKKSKISFCVIMILAFVAICLGDVPENKFNTSIEYIYGFNQLSLSIKENRFDYMESLYARDDIKEMVLQYEGSVPEGINPDDPDDPNAYADYELSLWTLPENEENLHIEDCLAYGRYIENDNEIILSQDLALEMGDPEKLIGQTMEVKLYDGKHNMTIVGIFREFTEIERQYLYNSGIGISGDGKTFGARYGISAKYTNKYINDMGFTREGGVGRQYILYFDSYPEMMEFYDEVYVEPKDSNGVFFIPPEVDLSLERVFTMMHTYIFPIAILIMLIAVIFYYQTQKTELMYNKKMFAVFQYLGYSVKRVKIIWMTYNMIELVKIFGLSITVTLLTTYLVNIVNRQMVFIPFEIFTYNIEVILLLFGAVIVIGILNSFFMLRKIRPETINKNLMEQKDLL